MKRGIISIALIIFLCTFISAEIILTEQIKEGYNLGEVINIPVIIKTVSDLSGNLKINLLCDGKEKNLLTWGGIKLKAGEEKLIPYSFELVKDTIGESKGMCTIKIILNEDYKLTEKFKISSLLNIQAPLVKNTFGPGDTIYLLGKVTKENKENANGFLMVDLISEENITREGTIFQGEFELNLTLPLDIAAGEYPLNILAYEKDSEGILTNEGQKSYRIYVKQVPNNVELILDKKEFLPEEIIQLKSILYDQGGKSINSTAFITIKDSKDKIIEQQEIFTDELFEYEIPQGAEPSIWKIYVIIDNLNTEKTFEILSKESAEVNIINKTILIKNIGNTFYNETLLIKIENKSLNLDVELDVGEVKKYIMNAPDGEYLVKIISREFGEITEKVGLTGNAVGIKESSDSYSLTFFFWIGGILFLFLVFVFCWNKVYKKSFFGRMNFRERIKKCKEIPVIGEPTKKGNKAEISLSIRGEKQDASFICLKIKNIREIKTKKGSANETLQSIKEIGDKYKSTVYEDNDYLFFILTPAKTRTFKNEKTAFEFSEKIQNILIDHNRRFNEKINFGISLDKGTIIGKLENGIFKFMSLSPIITSARKIASISNEKILLSKKMNESLRLIAKTEKVSTDEAEVYSVTQIKKENEEAKRFISKFMERQKGN